MNRGAVWSFVVVVCIALDEMCSLIGFGRKFQTFSIPYDIYLPFLESCVCIGNRISHGISTKKL